MLGVRRMLTTAGATLLAVGIFTGPALANVSASTEAQVTPIATGLDNPRAISIAPWGGGIYVAEAGHGADPGSTECVPGGEPGEEPTCVGFTSGVSRITSSGTHRVLNGIVSLAEPSGFAALEGTAADYASYTPAAWVLAAQPGRIANIIFEASEAEMEADCVKAEEGNAGSLYVTDLAESPNPYAALPSYWAAETSRC